MANPTGASDNHGQEVDLDDIEVEILIIARNPASLKATAQFLNRRGWPTTVIGNVQKALEFAAEKRPDYVLISFSHQNPAIHQIEGLVSKNYESTCVAYVEKTDALSNQKLMQVKMRHKIFGQPSGPNFQRAIRKLLSDRLNIEQGERSAAKAAAKAANQASRPEHEPTENSDEDAIYRASGEAKAASDGITIAEGKDGSGNPFVQHNGKARRSLKQIIDVNKTPSEKGWSGGESLPRADGELPERESSDPGANSLSAPSDSEDKELSARSRGSTQDSHGMGEGSEDSESEFSPQSFEPPRLANSLKDLHTTAKPFERSVRIEPHFKALESSSEDALKKIAVVRDDIELSPLTIVSGVAVFPVSSPPGCGYLVLALNDEVEARGREFLAACTKSLQESYREVNSQATVEPGFYITIPEVNFDEWTADQAQFTFYWEHRGSELGVAFFESPKALPALSTKLGMVTVGIEDISTQAPINFKAYLYMKMNRRYYLYLREGRLIQEKQKTRLKSKAVYQLFTKSVDLHNLRAYIAGLHLAETVRKFKKVA